MKELSSLDASEFESSKQTEILPNEIESDDAEEHRLERLIMRQIGMSR